MPTIRAADCVCAVCGKAKAVAFWPCIDPDIKSHPYCQSCLDKAQTALLIKLAEMDEPKKGGRRKKSKADGNPTESR